MFTADVAPLLSPVNYPLLRLTWHRLQGNGSFLKVESSLPFCDRGHKLFLRVGVIINLKRFDVLFDKKLFIIIFFLLFFVLFFCLFLLVFVKGQRWPIRVVVILDSSILLGKKSAERRTKYVYNKLQNNG